MSESFYGIPHAGVLDKGTSNKGPLKLLEVAVATFAFSGATVNSLLSSLSEAKRSA